VGWGARRQALRPYADILGVVEAETRPSLDRFNQERIPEPFTYEHVMLIDGNDTRGIDVQR
jgi:hypothetical protein